MLINLPDPPEVHAGRNEENMPVFLEYMEYMEGLAANLPRVLYVHGTGQEVIRAGDALSAERAAPRQSFSRVSQHNDLKCAYIDE